MPTRVTLKLASQSRSASSCCVVVPKVRISCRRAPCSPGTRTQAVMESLCTSSPAQRSMIRSIVSLLSRTVIARRPEEPHRKESELRAHGDSRGCLRLPRHTFKRASGTKGRADVDRTTSAHFHPSWVAAPRPWVTFKEKVMVSWSWTVGTNRRSECGRSMSAARRRADRAPPRASSSPCSEGRSS